MSALSMERRCSCAAPQILSAEACMFLAQKPEKRAVYSPDHSPHSEARYGYSRQHGIVIQPTKSGKPARKFQNVNPHTRHKCLSCNYLQMSHQPAPMAWLRTRVSIGLKYGPSVVFRETVHNLRGQHINSCSRVIHSQ